MYKDILNTHYAYEYVDACQEMREYFADDKIEPAALAKRYKDVLRNLRVYLDSMDYKMPNPIYPYQREDTETHKFLDVKVSADSKTGMVKYLGVLSNLNYKYRK